MTREREVALRATFRDPADGRAWMLEPLPALGGRTPAELVRDGQVSQVLALLSAINADTVT